MTSIPEYARDLTRPERNYYANIMCDKNENVQFIRDRKIIIIKNAKQDGTLLDTRLPLEKIREQEGDGVSPYCVLSVRQFKISEKTVDVPVCVNCNDSIDSISTKTSFEILKKILCRHAKIVARILRDFDVAWSLDGALFLSPDDEEEPPVNRVDILKTKKDLSTKSQHLAVVFQKDKVSLLYTTGKKRIPYCSKCSADNCNCRELWRAKTKDTLNTQRNETEAETENVNDEMTHYLLQNKFAHINKTEVIFPPSDDPLQAQIIDKKKKGTYTLPTCFIPEYSELHQCKHGNFFDPDNESLRVVSNQITIYTISGQTTHPTRVFGRRAIGGCKCIQHYDSHREMLWNIGENGEFICYELLNHYLIHVTDTGVTEQAFHTSISHYCSSRDEPFNLTYKAWLKALEGYKANIVFNYEDCYSCENCEKNPRFFVADGHACAPLCRKLKHLNLSELGPHPSDKQTVPQASTNKERLLIESKKDRDLFTQFLTEKVSLEEFCKPQNWESSNSILIHNIIKQYRYDNPEAESLPQCYTKFFTEVCSGTAVAGIMQATSSASLKILKEFSQRKLDLRSGNHSDEIQLLKSDLPVVWRMLNDICMHHDSNFLPQNISRVILKMISVRYNTFTLKQQRYFDQDVFTYEKDGVFAEHPLAFYPHFPILTYPKRYETNNTTYEDDWCSKNFPEHSDFAAGIFSVGCPCRKSITYGFELMLGPESARFPFKFLMNRKHDRTKLRGFIWDYACGLHRYALNREPEEFQNMQFLVDGCHFKGQKRLKKGSKKDVGAKGHLGCSASYNWMEYKPYQTTALNSQSREQMHSVLKKLSPSLRQMNYYNFMRTMICFFSIRNLIIKGKLKSK